MPQGMQVKGYSMGLQAIVWACNIYLINDLIFYLFISMYIFWGVESKSEVRLWRSKLENLKNFMNGTALIRMAAHKSG